MNCEKEQAIAMTNRFCMSRIALPALLLLLFSSCLAQTKYREHTNNTNAWLMYFGNHKFSPVLGWHAEVQVRRHDVVREWQQLLLRTGLDIYTKQVRFTIGYAFIETYPYGEFAVANAFPEHRIWQQALVSQAVGNIRLSHRYRLEQRMIGNTSTGEFRHGRYENRFRYMIKGTMPLKGNTLEAGEFFLAAYDEVFINFGKEVRYNLFDQNRLYAALGFHLGKIGKLECGVLYQVVQQGTLLQSGADYYNKIENNFAFQLGLFSDLSFYKTPKE